MARTGDTDWLDLHCPLCGRSIKLSDEEISQHSGPDGTECLGSGRRAAIPNVAISAPYECDLCGQVTRSNLRTGIVHSHNLAGQTAVCGNSGKWLGPIGSSVEVTLLPPKKPAKQKPVPQRLSKGYGEESGSSVRTVQGGLPGLGKRA